MNGQPHSSHLGKAFVANASSLVAFAVLSFVGTRLFSTVPAAEGAQALAAAIALVIALRFRARPAALLLAAALAFLLPLFISHMLWGSSIVRGAQTHLTIVAAAAAGVTLGAFLRRGAAAAPRQDAHAS